MEWIEVISGYFCIEVIETATGHANEKADQVRDGSSKADYWKDST